MIYLKRILKIIIISIIIPVFLFSLIITTLLYPFYIIIYYIIYGKSGVSLNSITDKIVDIIFKPLELLK